MLRVIVAMTIASAATAMGQILIGRGTQVVGSLETYAPFALVAYFAQALSNPYIIGGTILNAVFYFLLLTTLSWTGVTVALSLSALEYSFAAMLAVIILQEQVTPLRWLGDCARRVQDYPHQRESSAGAHHLGGVMSGAANQAICVRHYG
jgi:drug/metabolite transporter (DMT)-like permease